MTRSAPFRVLITGDRRWTCHAVAREVITRLVAKHGAVDIVQGAAAGVDHAFVEAAYDAGCGVCSYPADWNAHGKKAGPIRNQEMVDSGADLCLAVHRDLDASKGTRDCVNRALKAGIPVWLIDSEAVEPRPIREATP